MQTPTDCTQTWRHYCVWWRIGQPSKPQDRTPKLEADIKPEDHQSQVSWEHEAYLVDVTALVSDLAFLVCEHSDLSHANHRAPEVLEELLCRRCHGLALDVRSRLGVVEESLIGCEEAFPLGDELVVAQVKSSGALGIHLHQGPHVIMIMGFAFPLQLFCVLHVQWWVRVTLPAEVIQSLREGWAMGETDGVCT